MKGAMEDPALQRAMSDTGLTSLEELSAFNADFTGILINMFMRANFEEPTGGWPEPARIARPKEPPKPDKKRREKDPEAPPDWRLLVDFTNQIHREAHGE